MINAQIVADSKNEFGQRITSFILTYPRIIHAEMMTHRMFSRNAASSRAIPASKMIEKVENNPFIPIKFQKHHSGMQGTEYFEGKDHETARDLWLSSKDMALIHAKEMLDFGVTKQIINRTLEPYQWYTALFTATEWENFFALRADEPAEIHIQDLAFKMLEEYNNSEPKQLKAGEWHIPFGDNMDVEKLANIAPLPNSSHTEFEDLKVKIATARCARVSYENFDGSDDYQKDINLHDRLASMGHWSPFEHCARAMSEKEYHQHVRTSKANTISTEAPEDKDSGIVESTISYLDKEDLGWSGNFQGFIQYRKMFNSENKTDERVK